MGTGLENPWPALESVSGLCAVPARWRVLLGAQYDLFRMAFLQKRPDRQARFIPCPNGCPSWHEVFYYGADDIVAVCRCESSTCGDLALTKAEVVPLELSWPKLAGALCQGFDLVPKLTELGMPHTRQIGAWSVGAVAVFLAIQESRPRLRSVVAGLVARLRQPFILMSPSSRNLDAGTQELLANVGAGFFSLEAHARLNREGRIISLSVPGQLFSKFTPQPAQPVSEDEARSVFAVVRALDSEALLRKAPVYTVFRLYCIEGLTPDQIAHRCRCARSLVYSRIERLHQKLGRDPAELRQYSAHFERMEESLSDSRARRIYRKQAIYGEEGEDE